MCPPGVEPEPEPLPVPVIQPAIVSIVAVVVVVSISLGTRPGKVFCTRAGKAKKVINA